MTPAPQPIDPMRRAQLETAGLPGDLSDAEIAGIKRRTLNPQSLRVEAARQGRLADEAFRRRDAKQASVHIDRARDLALLACDLERPAISTEGQ